MLNSIVEFKSKSFVEQMQLGSKYPSKLFQASLTFSSKAGAYPSKTPYCTPRKSCALDAGFTQCLQRERSRVHQLCLLFGQQIDAVSLFLGDVISVHLDGRECFELFPKNLGNLFSLVGSRWIRTGATNLGYGSCEVKVHISTNSNFLIFAH